MQKVCFMFSGQGSQKNGMGESLATYSKQAKQVFECASDILGYDVLKLCINNDKTNKIFQTKFAQPAIVAVSIAAFKALMEFNPSFQAAVGHSLGSISAIIATEIVSLEDGFKIVKARANAMAQCEENQDGAMYAIVGSPLDINNITTLCENASDYVICANYNGNNQVVISGTTHAVEDVILKLKNEALRCIKLNVKTAFHSELMSDAIAPFENEIESINFMSPKIEVYSNVTGEKVKPTDNIKNLLVKQIVSPVLFTTNLNNLNKEGFETFIEFGPSKPLCSMVKATIPNAKTLNVCDEQSLKNVVTFFTK